MTRSNYTKRTYLDDQLIQPRILPRATRQLKAVRDVPRTPVVIPASVQASSRIRAMKVVDEFEESEEHPLVSPFKKNFHTILFFACGMLLFLLLMIIMQTIPTIDIPATAPKMIKQIASIIPYIKALDSDPLMDLVLKLLGGLASFGAVIPLLKNIKRKTTAPHKRGKV